MSIQSVFFSSSRLRIMILLSPRTLFSLALLAFCKLAWCVDGAGVEPVSAAVWWEEQQANAELIRAGMRQLDRDWTPARYARIDDALKDNAERLERLLAAGGFSPVERALRLDRALALAARGRDDEAARLLTELGSDAALPPFAIQVAGDVAMRQRRPLEAARHYRAALAVQPESVALHVNLAYAYLEAGQLHELESTLSTLERIDRASLDVRLLRVRMTRFNDRLAQAQQLVDALGADERDAVEAALEAAALAQARGLPRTAEKTYAGALAAAPDNIRAAVGLAEAAWAAGALDEVHAQLDRLNEHAPEHPAVRRLTNSWNSARRAWLSMEVNAGCGYGSIAGKDDISTDLWLHGPLATSGLRLFAHHHRVAADFDDNRAQHIRVGAGLELTRRDWSMAAELGRERTYGRDTTFSLRGSLQASDHWGFRASAESHADDVSVKGRYYYLEDFGTVLSAHRLALGVTHFVNESRRFLADVGYYDFKDGNSRETLTTTWIERVHAAPRHTIDVHGAAYTSSNTRAGAEYFNPKRDYALSATIVSDWLTWHDYGRRFNQRVAASLGSYRQQSAAEPRDTEQRDIDHGWKVFGELRYEHEWKASDELSARYGIGVRRFPYDGDHETRAYLYGALSMYF